MRGIDDHVVVKIEQLGLDRVPERLRRLLGLLLAAEEVRPGEIAHEQRAADSSMAGWSADCSPS